MMPAAIIMMHEHIIDLIMADGVPIAVVVSVVIALVSIPPEF